VGTFNMFRGPHVSLYAWKFNSAEAQPG